MPGYSSEFTKSVAFEAAFVDIRNQRANFRSLKLVDCSDYERPKNNFLNPEIPVAVIGGFAVGGELKTDEIIRDSGLAEYDADIVEAQSRIGTHLDKVLKTIDQFTGGKRDYFAQTFHRARVEEIFLDYQDEPIRFIAGSLTYFKPITGELRSDFVYDKKFDLTQTYVRALSAEDSLSELAVKKNSVKDIAAIESDEARALLATAAASCCVKACGCAGVSLSSGSSRN